MRFLVDNQLPPSPARWLRNRGHDTGRFFGYGWATVETTPCSRRFLRLSIRSSLPSTRGNPSSNSSERGLRRGRPRAGAESCRRHSGREPCRFGRLSDAFANDLGEPIDLSSFSGMESALEESQQTLGADGMPIVQVYDDGGARWIRPYVTGIAGASFGTLNTGGRGGFGGTPLGFAGSVNEAMFTGGGAIGVALDQPSGLLRMEIEGRARGPMQGKDAVFCS